MKRWILRGTGSRFALLAMIVIGAGGGMLAVQPTSAITQLYGPEVDLHPSTTKPWIRFTDLAAGAMVSVETVVTADVTVQDTELKTFHKLLRDSQLRMTGVYVNQHRSVVTSTGAGVLSEKQTRRLRIYAINSAFKELGFLKELPKDPYQSIENVTTYTQGSSTFGNGGPAATQQRLQDCYRQSPRLCTVVLHPEPLIFPSVNDVTVEGITPKGIYHGDDITILDLGLDEDRTPLTLHVAETPMRGDFKVVASNGANLGPRSLCGSFTGNAAKPITDKDLNRYFGKFTDDNQAAPGALVVNQQGDLVAMLDSNPEGDGLVAIPGSVIGSQMINADVKNESSLSDKSYRNGVRFLENGDFARASRSFKELLPETHNLFAVQALLSDAEAGLRYPRSTDESQACPANDTVEPTADQQPDRRSTWPIVGVVGLVVALIASVIAGLVVVRRRRRDARRDVLDLTGLDPPDRAPEAEEMAITEQRPVLRRSLPPGFRYRPGGGGLTTRLAADAQPRMTGPAGSDATSTLCPQCMRQLAPQDRFCSACGCAVRER